MKCYMSCVGLQKYTEAKEENLDTRTVSNVRFFRDSVHVSSCVVLTVSPFRYYLGFTSLVTCQIYLFMFVFYFLYVNSCCIIVTS